MESIRLIRSLGGSSNGLKVCLHLQNTSVVFLFSTNPRKEFLFWDNPSDLIYIMQHMYTLALLLNFLVPYTLLTLFAFRSYATLDVSF